MRQAEHYGQPNSGHNSGSPRLGWQGSYGNIAGNYYYTPSIRQLSADVSGGAIIHRHGLTLGPQINGTSVLVEVPGVGGVTTTEDRRLKTDFRGYSIVSGLSLSGARYRVGNCRFTAGCGGGKNRYQGLADRGAIVRASFSPQIGAKALMTITRANGQTIPFGAMASLVNQSANAAIVDEGESLSNRVTGNRAVIGAMG